MTTRDNATHDRERECDFPHCTDPGIRHLMSGYFCGKHRDRIINERPGDLLGYVRRLKEAGSS